MQQADIRLADEGNDRVETGLQLVDGGVHLTITTTDFRGLLDEAAGL